MTLSEFTLRLIVIFLPGLIAFIIVEQLTVNKETAPYRFFINALMMGFLCYLLYYPFSLIPVLNLKFSFIASLSSNKVPLDFKEIGVVVLLAIPMGLVVSLFINRKYLHKAAQWLKVTNKFGDHDVWSYILNSEIPGWVVIRDKDSDLMYEGWIQATSDSTDKDELFLRDVKVFSNSTGELFYEVPGLYLPRNRESLIIEFPALRHGASDGERNRPSAGEKNE